MLYFLEFNFIAINRIPREFNSIQTNRLIVFYKWELRECIDDLVSKEKLNTEAILVLGARLSEEWGTHIHFHTLIRVKQVFKQFR